MAVDISDVIANDFLKKNASAEAPSADISDAIANDFLSKQRPQKAAENEFNWGRFIPEQAAQAATELTDIPGEIVESLVQSPASPLMYPEYEKEYGIHKTPIHIPKVSSKIKKALKSAGIDIETQKPKTAAQRMAGHGIKFATQTAAPMGILTKGTTALGRAAMGSAIGTTAGGLQELGVGPFPATIAAGIGVPGALSLLGTGINAGRYMVSPKYREASALKQAEKEASQHLRNIIGEDNIPEVLQNLEQTSIPGVTQMTAERSKNVGLAQLHRKFEGSEGRLAEEEARGIEELRAKLFDIPEGSHMPRDVKEFAAHELEKYGHAPKKAVEELGERLPSAEAGETVGRGIRGHYKKLRDERREITQPLYEKVKEIKTELLPSHTQEAFKTYLPKTKGDIKKALEKAEEYFIPEEKAAKLKKLKEEIKTSKDDLTSKGGKITSELEKGYKKILDEAYSMSPEEMKNAIKALSHDIKVAKRAGHDEIVHHLSKIRKAAKADIAQIPEELAARSKYAELTPPIVERKKHPVVGKILKKDYETGHYLIGESEIPHKLINKSMQTKEYAADYVKTYGNDKKTMQATREYINHDVVDSITDSNGVVDIKALEKWKEKNPYYKDIYPELDTKLKNIHNAQLMSNHAYVKNMKAQDSYFKGAFQDLTHENPDKIARSLLSGTDRSSRMNEALKILDNDKTGHAKEGLRRAFIFDLMHQTKSASINAKGMNNFVPNSYLKYWKENRSEFVKLFDEDQIKLLDNVYDYMHKKQTVASAGFSKNSHTHANDTISKAIEDVPAGVLKKGLKKIWGAGPLLDFVESDAIALMKNAKKDLLVEALIDPEKAKFLITKVGDKKALESIVEKLKNKAYLGLPIGLAKETEGEE